VASEGEWLSQFSHQNIVQYEAAFQEKNCLHIVMELCVGGTLQDDIERGCYRETQAARVMFQILDAVNYMHDQGISHRDLKPANILYCDESLKTLKIIDFGFCKDLNSDSTQLFTITGTLDYCCNFSPLLPSLNPLAPEIFSGNYNYFAIDMWSVGCILYTLYIFVQFQNLNFSSLFGYSPFSQQRGIQQVVEAAQKSNFSLSRPEDPLSQEGVAKFSL